MASLRPNMLFRGVSAMLQLERQAGLLRVSPSPHITAAQRIGAVAAAASQARFRSMTERFDPTDDREVDIAAEMGKDMTMENYEAMKAELLGLEVPGAADGAGSVYADEPRELSDADGFVNWDRSKIIPPVYARPRPVMASYFTQQPHFNERMLELEDMFRRFANLPRVPAEDIKRISWRSLDDYRRFISEDIRSPQYKRAMTILKSLNRIQPALKVARIDEITLEFVRTIHTFDNVMNPIPIDRFGRAIGVGRRKTSTARAWVVEGTGEILVNGKTLGDAFGRVHDRESATWALRATDRMDKYNVWALVEGGGTTGQAEALTMAVARGIMAHEPALKSALRLAGTITRDPRMVERKKPGHLKARKMPAWVKR